MTLEQDKIREAAENLIFLPPIGNGRKLTKKSTEDELLSLN